VPPAQADCLGEPPGDGDRHVDQEIQRLGLRSPDAIERLAQATYSRLKPVNDRRFEVLLQHASPEAANDHPRPPKMIPT